MDFEEAQPFFERHHWSVVTTHQTNGAAHSSIVVCGAYQGHAAFVAVHGSSAKVRNLRRDPRCSVLVVSKTWHSWVNVEGEARLFDYDNTDVEEVRTLLRNVYRACGEEDHPDWEEYDQAMRAQEGVVVLVRPDRVYGQVRE